MKNIVQHIRTRLPTLSRRQALGLACLLLLGLAIALSIGRGKGTSQEVPISAVGVSFLGKESHFDAPEIYLNSVSSDGKWICAHGPGSSPMGPMYAYFFDIEEGRYVARIPIPGGYTPSLFPGGQWTPESMIMEGYAFENRAFNSRVWQRLIRWLNVQPPVMDHIYAVDFRARRARLLLREPKPNEGLVPSYFPNNDLTAIAYQTSAGPGESRRARIIIRYLRTGRRRTFRLSDLAQNPRIELWLNGWLPDNRTLVLLEKREFVLERVFFLDSKGKEGVRKLPVAARFRNAEDPLETEGRITHCIRFLRVCDGGRTVRFSRMEPFPDREHPERGTWNVWDLSVDTEKLQLVAESRDSNSPLWEPIFSPSASSILVPIAATSATDHLSYPSAATLELYTSAGTPRKLPFSISWNSWNSVPPRSPKEALQFLDEETLVYTGSGRELWKFDLRTWKSELLWRPNMARREQP